MKCSVYRSTLKDFTYIYLRHDLKFDDLPEGLRKQFGPPTAVLDLDLTPERVLAQEDSAMVIANLESEGYHLQLPPREDASGWLELPPG